MTEAPPAAGPQRGSAPAAVLWDMDGTLVDTEPYWLAAESELAAAYGGTWTREDGLALVGTSLLAGGEVLRQRVGLPLTTEEVVERLLDGVVARVEHEVPWCPGARETLAMLAEAGVPCALVTMSYQRFVEPVLAGLPDDTFAAVVTGDAVANGKPHPEPYLTAARLLGIPPERCVAVEDSTPGATSAQAAGCRVLVVPNHAPVGPAPGRTFRESLVGLTLGDLEKLPDRDPAGADLP